MTCAALLSVKIAVATLKSSHLTQWLSRLVSGLRRQTLEVGCGLARGLQLAKEVVFLVPTTNYLFLQG